MKNLIVHFIFVISFFILLAGASLAQQATATLTGVVTDPNGAIIQGATVMATNKATNLSRTVMANDEGVYTISSLPVGEYEVKIEAAGFTTIIFQGVAVSVGQTIKIDSALQVGEIYVGSELIGEPSLVETTNSKVDAVINDREIENLRSRRLRNLLRPRNSGNHHARTRA